MLTICACSLSSEELQQHGNGLEQLHKLILLAATQCILSRKNNKRWWWVSDEPRMRCHGCFLQDVEASYETPDDCESSCALPSRIMVSLCSQVSQCCGVDVCIA